MKIKFQGFLFESSNSIPLVWDLAFPQGEKAYHYRRDRFLKIDWNGDSDFLLGAVITPKGQKHFTERTETCTGESVLACLTPENELVDFNCFVMHKRTHRGIYQYYYGSLPLLSFIGEVCTMFKDRRNEYVQENPKRCGINNLKNTDLSGTPCYRQETFNDLVAALRSIKRVDIKGCEIQDADEAVFSQDLAGAIKQRNESYLFVRNTPPGRIFGLLQGNTGAKRMRVTGMDSDGLERYFELRNNLDDFGVEDYDRVVGTISTSVTKLTDMGVIQLLLAKARASTFVNSDDSI